MQILTQNCVSLTSKRQASYLSALCSLIAGLLRDGDKYNLPVGDRSSHHIQSLDDDLDFITYGFYFWLECNNDC